MAGSAHAATLLGQSVSASLSSFAATSISDPFPSPVVTFAGTDFTGGFTDVFDQTWAITVDLTATTLTINFSTPGDAGGNVGDNSGAAIIDLTGFSGLTTPLHLESYTCDSGSTVCGAFGPGPFDTITLSNSTTFDVNFSAIQNGDTYVFTIVPEPATWALLMAGVAFAGASLRLRRRFRLSPA
jgi:hypothetical protein